MSEPTAKTSVGILFRRLRKLAGLNMAEAARKLDVSVPTISCIENDGLGVLPAQRPFVPSEETTIQAEHFDKVNRGEATCGCEVGSLHGIELLRSIARDLTKQAAGKGCGNG
jgi:transcriptional regulator with XRE-family HTH domain